jgi:hypothetical protein
MTSGNSENEENKEQKVDGTEDLTDWKNRNKIQEKKNEVVKGKKFGGAGIC